MNCLDKKRLNRIDFPQFLRLYRGLYDSKLPVGSVLSTFNKYDNGSGMLTIVDIFKFCCDEDRDLEESSFQPRANRTSTPRSDQCCIFDI